MNGHHDHHDHNHNASPEETLALLRYMADHNAHHAGELAELAAALPENAAVRVREAVALLNASTDRLREAIAETEV